MGFFYAFLKKIIKQTKQQQMNLVKCKFYTSISLDNLLYALFEHCGKC